MAAHCRCGHRQAARKGSPSCRRGCRAGGPPWCPGARSLPGARPRTCSRSRRAAMGMDMGVRHVLPREAPCPAAADSLAGGPSRRWATPPWRCNLPKAGPDRRPPRQPRCPCRLAAEGSAGDGPHRRWAGHRAALGHRRARLAAPAGVQDPAETVQQRGDEGVVLGITLRQLYPALPQGLPSERRLT